MHYERSIDIAAPPDAVWRVLADVERWPEWTRSTRSLKLENGDRLNAASRATIDLAGAPPSRWVATAFDDGRSFVWENRQPGIRNVAGHHVDASGAGTRVRLTIDISGPLALLLRPWLAYVTRRNVGWEIEGLKRYCEGSARA